MFGYIYRTYLPRRGRFYIGQRHGDFDPLYFGIGTRLIRELDKYGSAGLVVDVLGVSDSQDTLDDLEMFHIRVHKDFGFDLINILPGGRGMAAGYSRPAWIGAKISASKSGIATTKHTPEWRQKVSKSLTGRRHSPEAIAKMKGKYKLRAPITEETRLAMRLARLGKHFSPLTAEHRANLSKSNRSAWLRKHGQVK